MTAAEQREKARLRSERWRRAHGIEPRRPAQRPWPAEGISRSTWYRRRKQVREREASAAVAVQQQAMLDCAEAFSAALARDLDRCAMLHAVMARELNEPWTHAIGT
jgi:hypothetical protein